MPKLIAPLTDIQVKNAKPRDKPYKLADGGGLYLEVTPTGSKLWRMKFKQANGKEGRLSFGIYPLVSLVQAREKRDEARKLKTEGIDPGQFKREEKQTKASEAANTFERVARAWLGKSAAKRAESTHKKSVTLLEQDIFPAIGQMPISAIKPTDVLEALRKIERRGALETTSKARRLCSQVFKYAVAEGLIERDATADIGGALATAEKKHYAAITAPKQAGELMRAIEGYQGNIYSVAALKLSPLVFVRPGELRAAEWSEIDLDAAEWRIPASKMKMKTDHLVPLSTQAVEILRNVQAVSGRGKYVFPSLRTGERCMSENTVAAALRRMGYDSETMTAHGFRAMARTIMDEVLGERVDLIEHQLAHAVKDPNGRAYNRTAHLPARRQMMQRWADYLDKLKAGADVIPFKSTAA